MLQLFIFPPSKILKWLIFFLQKILANATSMNTVRQYYISITSMNAADWLNLLVKLLLIFIVFIPVVFLVLNQAMGQLFGEYNLVIANYTYTLQEQFVIPTALVIKGLNGGIASSIQFAYFENVSLCNEIEYNEANLVTLVAVNSSQSLAYFLPPNRYEFRSHDNRTPLNQSQVSCNESLTFGLTTILQCINFCKCDFVSDSDLYLEYKQISVQNCDWMAQNFTNTTKIQQYKYVVTTESQPMIGTQFQYLVQAKTNNGVLYSGSVTYNCLFGFFMFMSAMTLVFAVWVSRCECKIRLRERAVKEEGDNRATVIWGQ